ELRVAKLQVKRQYEEKVITRLRQLSVSSPITIAIDDYTNTNHIKITNIMPMAGGMAYYWNTIFNSMDEEHSANWLYPRIGKCLHDIIQFKITVVAIVAD